MTIIAPPISKEVLRVEGVKADGAEEEPIM